MADDLLQISDLVADALDVSQQEISDLLDAAPFFMRLPFTPSSNGTVHKYNKETQAPVVGFRAENAGRAFDHGVDTVVSVTLKILDFSSQVDKAVAHAWRRGGAEALIARKSFRHLKAAMAQAEAQFMNGVNNDASGFVGFQDATGLDALADTMVYDAGGGAVTDTAYTSVYLVRMGEDAVSGVMIEDNPFEIGDTVVVNALDGSSKNFPAFYTPACTWMGMQIGGAYHVARIANVAASGSGVTLTDDMISEGISLFKASEPPTHVVMNRRSLKQLQQSRTATNPTGAPAPFPSESFGIPIIVTDALGNAESEVV